MSKILFSVAVLFLLAGCHNDSAPSSQSSVIPGQLSDKLYQKMLITKTLSPDAQSKIAGFMKTSTASIPSMDLVFDKYKKEERKQRHLNRLDSAGHLFLNKIKDNCEIQPEKTTTTGSYEAGKTARNESKKAILGPNCPVSFSSKTNTEIATTSFDKTKMSITGTFKVEGLETLSIHDENVKLNTNTVATKSRSTITAVAEDFSSDSDGDIRSGGMHMTGNMEGELTQVNGSKVPVKMEFEWLQRSGQKEIQLYGVFKFQEGDLFLGAIRKGGKTEIFVNGEPYTEQRLQDEFGTDVLDLE